MTPKVDQDGIFPDSASDLLLDENQTQAFAVLRARPSALISDVDGTLSPIVSSPQEAEVLPECRSALAKLAESLDLVAVVSGRQVEDARRMVGLDQLTYIGNHGLESWSRVDGYRNKASSYTSTVAEVVRILKDKLESLDGIHLEDKGNVVSIHYRTSPDPAIARQAILEAIEEIPAMHGLAIGEGKRVIEIRPPLVINKGTVITELAKAYRLKGILYLGDDLTDIDAFQAIRDLRETGEVLGLSAGVGGTEMPNELAAASDILLSGPEAAARFLQVLSEAISKRQREPA
jgi:trehalose 6-phosphate phosphatase